MSTKKDESSFPILHADVLEWASSYTGPRFNLLHCDFPYGIDFDKMYRQNTIKTGDYADTEEAWLALSEILADRKIVSDSAHLIFWFASKTHLRTLARLTELGWTVNPTPLIWWRSDNSGILPDPKRGPRQVYETAFLASRGDRLIVRARSNLIAAPDTKKWHTSEKPLAVVEHFLSMLVDETTILLDPTCGSANAVIAAERLGASHAVGVESDREAYETALQNWKENASDG